MLARLVALVVALALQTVAGQELYITTATSSYADSGGRVTVELVDSAGSLKAQTMLGNFRSKGALTTWNANGAGWAVGDQLRFKWTSGDGWRVSGLSLSGFVLAGQAAPFWMDADQCESCNPRVACGGGAVQWNAGECYSQLQCNNQAADCATRMIWTLRDPSASSSGGGGGGGGDNSGPDPVVIIAVIAGVVVLLVVGIAVFVFMKKKKRAPTAQPTQPVTQPIAPKGRFDPNTGKEIPKFDPMTGVQNW